MEHDDRHLEAFLRQFRPRQPAPLPHARPMRLRWTPASVAAAIVVGILAASLLWQRPGDETGDSTTRSASSASALTVHGLSEQTSWDVDALDALLLDPTLLALPDVEAPGGALHDLSRP